MSEVVEYVAVERPTALETLDPPVMMLPGQDLWPNYVKNLHVLPDRLDLEKFKLALSRAVSRYPHAGGRLKRSGDDWMIELTNLPIPVTIVDKDNEEGAQAEDTAPPTDAFPFPNTFILRPMLAVQPFEPQVDFFLTGDGNGSLLSVKITYWKNKTIIGIAWNHTLGDAKAMFDFSVCLSGLYQDLDAPDSKLPLKPNFHRQIYTSRLQADEETTHDFEHRMPHLRTDYEVSELWKMYTETEERTEQIQIRLDGNILDEIFRRAQESGHQEFKITMQDAISAYLVTVLNRCYETPVQCVINAVNYRFPAHASSYPVFAHPATSANCILMMYSDKIPSDSLLSIPTIAQIVRKSINDGRKPEFVDMWVSFASGYMRKSANAGRKQWFAPYEGECTINSNYRYDWNDAHFGFGNKARFFTAWTAERYFRVFAANPVDGENNGGTSPANVVFLVRKDLKEKCVSILKADFANTAVEEV